MSAREAHKPTCSTDNATLGKGGIRDLTDMVGSEAQSGFALENDDLAIVVASFHR
jgi:hypothetical protein